MNDFSEILKNVNTNDSREQISKAATRGIL